jgi:predicted GNAT family acetyltransferase
MNSIQIQHDPAAQRFSTAVEGWEAVLEYRVNDSVMCITHTGVPAPIAGRGIAAALMRAAIETASGAGWRIDPRCSYAAAFLRRSTNTEQNHLDALLDEGLDESFPASDPPSVGASS